jgi:hypothetical protein
LIPTVSLGQDEASTVSVFSDYLNPEQNRGFLHIPGLEFNSSMGFSYMSSKHYGSMSMGYYMGHFGLRLSSSLTLRWDVGLRSNLTAPDGGQSPEFFLPNVDLTYRPNKKFLLRFQFSQHAYPYYNPYRRY